jgi:hypothetical protein
MDAKTEYARGFSDGYEGVPSGPFQNKTNLDYLAGHAAGTKRRYSEHRSTCVDLPQTPNMIRSEDCRKVKGFNG